MKKYLLLTFILIDFGLIASAQGKISLYGIQEIENQKKISRSENSEQKIEVIVKVDHDFEDSDLEQFDATIVSRIGDDLLIVSLPVTQIEELSELDSVKYIEFGRKAKPMLDYARPASNVSSIQDGFQSESGMVSFDGTDVVTGLMDQGLDPEHINFTNVNGSSRVVAAYDFDRNLSCTTAADIKRLFRTDDPSESHGTHVAGIMAGGYRGNGTFCYVTTPDGGDGQQIDGNIPFYGVAPNASIVMAAGTFTDAKILKGVQAVVDYAKKVGLPAVVNLSLGSNMGPHDGSGLLEQGLRDLAQDALICVAAGNEGDENIFVGQTFDETNTELKTFILDNSFGGIDVWSNDSEPLTVKMGLYDTTRRRLVTVATISEPGQSANSSTNATFAQYMNGSFSMISEVNGLNNRFHVNISGSFEQSLSGRYAALVVSGKPGQQVYVYGYGNTKTTEFTSNAVSGYVNGTTDGSISDMACGENLISVGSYNSRTTWGTFGGVRGYVASFVVNDVSPFSSFGTNFQGKTLPLICAPGANILSSYSRYYTNQMTEANRTITTSAVVEGSSMNNYWGPMQGTSMACPYVAGTVALWLEADPTLKVGEVIDILKSTSITPDVTNDLKRKQWGGGKLDALAGIKEVLRRKAEAGVDGVLADAGGYVITPVGDRSYNIVVDGADRLTARLYNMQGVAVATANGRGGELTLDASAVARGVYILAVETPNTAPVTRRLKL